MLNTLEKSPKTSKEKHESIKRYFGNRILETMDVVLHIDEHREGSKEFEETVHQLVSDYVSFYGDYVERPEIFFNLCVNDALVKLAMDECETHWLDQPDETMPSHYDDGTKIIYRNDLQA